MTDIPTSSPFGDPYYNTPGQTQGTAPTSGYPGAVGRLRSVLGPGGLRRGDPNSVISKQGSPGLNGPPSSASGTVDTSKGTADQQDAFATTMDILDQYGLGTLAQWAWNEIVNGKSASGVQMDLRNTPEFHQRFKVIFDRQKAGLTPISPSDVINYEGQWHQMTRAAGLPDTFGSQQTADSLLGADVSLAEAQQRIDQGYKQVAQAPQEVRDAFQAYFGVNGDANLAAYFTDPNLALPDLERQVTEAQIGGVGHMQGFNVNESLAQQLARAGVSQSQAESGFGQLNQEKDLFSASEGDTSTVSADQGIQAQFGLSGDAATQLQKLADQRRAAFSGRSETVADQTGLTGTGQARSV